MTGQPEELEKFTKVPNDILDALAQAKLNGTQHAICLVIFRNTFGFHRCQHEMSATYIGKATNISARQIKRELQVLNDRNIILKTNLKKGVASIVGFNKEIIAWKPVTKKTPVSNPSPVVVSNKTPVPVSNPSPKKESIKENFKEIIMSPDEAEFIRELETVKDYPLNRQKDIEMFQTLEKRYPNTDILSVVKDWHINKLDNPLKKKDNPRSQINTWCSNANKWGKNKKSGGEEYDKYTAEEYRG